MSFPELIRETVVKIQEENSKQNKNKSYISTVELKQQNSRDQEKFTESEKVSDAREKR